MGEVGVSAGRGRQQSGEDQGECWGGQRQVQGGAVQGGYTVPGGGCSLKEKHKCCLYPNSVSSTTFDGEWNINSP